MDRKKWVNLEQSDGINLMFHRWPESLDVAIDAIRDCGFSGVVTNVPITKENPEVNERSVAQFKKIVEKLKEKNMPFWIYDEDGYPSGHGCFRVLKEHPEYVAKGFYMRKFELFDGEKDFYYEIDGMSDKIVYAVKYREDLSNVTEGQIDFSDPQPLPYEERGVRIRLVGGEVAYVFIVKDAYEGSHSVHNCTSRNKYINLLDPNAVKEFIRLNYQPIADGCEEAFALSRYCFTDEPSLMTAYCRHYETSNYALAPYSETLFEEFKERVGYDIHPWLPLIFEGTNEFYKKLRTDFYSFVGTRVAENYSGQISAWLHEHGGKLSGHYLAEENLYTHVAEYGSFEAVVEKADYPGMDILQALPTDFFWNAPKYLAMIARKKGVNGFMVEFCPFFRREEFDRAPFENFVGCASILYMYGCRAMNTYYLANMKGYDEKVMKDYGWGLSREEAVYLNTYIRRIMACIGDTAPVTDIAMYYNIEDVQAKFIPQNVGNYFVNDYLSEADNCYTRYAKELLPNGVNYEFFDGKDLTNGFFAKTMIIPACKFISDETAENLKKAEEQGAEILFTAQYPQTISGKESVGIGRVLSEEDVCSYLRQRVGKKYPRNIYVTPYLNGMTALYNNADSEISFKAEGYSWLYDPNTGENRQIGEAEEITVKAHRLVFLEN